jgi:hypothetical protein
MHFSNQVNWRYCNVQKYEKRCELDAPCFHLCDMHSGFWHTAEHPSLVGLIRFGRNRRFAFCCDKVYDDLCARC